MSDGLMFLAKTFEKMFCSPSMVAVMVTFVVLVFAGVVAVAIEGMKKKKEKDPWFS